MIEAIITFLDSATVKSFLAQYIATKVADTMFDKGSIEIHNLIKDNPEMQLLHVIEESIKTTCIKYNWDYQYIMSDRFAEETVNNQILVENDLRNLLSVTFGYDVSPQVVSFWMSSFFSLLSEEKNRKAKDYFNLYTNNRLIESTLQIEEQVRKINGIINQHVSEEYFHSVQQMSSLLKTIGMNSQRNYQLVESIPEVIETFVDREIELKSTFEQLKLHNCVFIGGMRGIGKTAFVQKYINKYRENYNCIVYFRCIEDLKSMIIDDSVITIRNLSRRIINNQKESDNEYFSRKIRVLREIVNEKVLFVIDGIELTDTALESITNIGAKFILITNNNVSNIPMTHMNIDSFCKKSDLLMLFKKYYFRNDINFQSKFLWEMFKKCQGHTLTIKLLALQMRANHKSPEEMYHLLEEKGLGNSMSDCIFCMRTDFKNTKLHLSLFAHCSDWKNWIMIQCNFLNFYHYFRRKKFMLKMLKNGWSKRILVK